MEMSVAAKPVLKVLTMADSCLLSLPSLISSKTTLPYYSVAGRAIKLQLSCCVPTPSNLFPSLPLGRKTRSSSTLTFVAHASGWAQQEEDNTVTLPRQETDEEDEQRDEAEGSLSNWKTEGEGYTDEEGGLFDDGGYVETSEGVAEEDGDSGEPTESPEGGFEDGDQAEPADDGDYEPPEEAKLFVGNLPYDVESQQLAALFEQAGTVEIAEVIFNRQTDQSRGFGFVTMSTVEEAEKAVEKFHRYELNGRLLNVNKAAPAGTKPERGWHKSSFRLYVGNLPWDVDNARLEQIFSEHVNVASARVIYDRESGRSRGFGFVEVDSETEMNDAITVLDGKSLDGRTLRVSIAEQRPRRAVSF